MVHPKVVFEFSNVWGKPLKVFSRQSFCAVARGLDKLRLFLAPKLVVDAQLGAGDLALGVEPKAYGGLGAGKRRVVENAAGLVDYVVLG